MLRPIVMWNGFGKPEIIWAGFIESIGLFNCINANHATLSVAVGPIEGIMAMMHYVAESVLRVGISAYRFAECVIL